MKDWKVVDVRALAGNSKRKVYAAAFALLAVLSLVFCAGLCGTQKAWADEPEVDLGAPAHVKALAEEPNDDGSWNLSLNVTGDSDSVSKKAKANVIVVLDTSGSMGNYEKVDESYAGDKYARIEHRDDVQYLKLTKKDDGRYYYTVRGEEREYTGVLYAPRLDVAKLAVNGLAENLLKLNTEASSDTVQMALVEFSRTAEDPFVATSYSDFSKKVNGLESGGGTNWEAALSKANSVDFGDTDQTYVVFVSDGNPTFRNTRGDYDEPDDGGLFGGWNWFAPHGTGEEGEPTLTRCYDHAKDDAKSIVDAKKSFYGVGVFGNVTKMQSLVNYAYTGSEAASETSAGHYFDATDQAKLNAAFSEIASDITKDYTYTNVVITDEMSEYVDVVLDPATNQLDFEYSYTKDGEPYTIASDVTIPAASYDSSTRTVTWNLGGVVLEKGVTYTVAFKVKPNQKAYDAAAVVANGGSDSLVKSENGKYFVYTNAKAELAYSQLETGSDGSQTPIAKPSVSYAETPAVPVDVAQLTIEKAWDGASAPVESVSVQVEKDGENYGSPVTLGKAGNWKKVLTVPVGYEYSIKELDFQASGWTVSYGQAAKLAANNLTGTLVVTNAYNASGVLGGDGAVKIEAKKTLKGRDLRDKEFTFNVKDGSGATVATGANDEDGNITFTPIEYDTSEMSGGEGGSYVYQYTVSEDGTGLADKGVTANSGAFSITVTLTDNGEGVLIPEVTYPDGASSLEFVNQYGSGDDGRVTLILAGTKVLSHASGLTPPDIAGKYTFTLNGLHAENLTANNDTVGNVRFASITYTMDDLKGVEADENGVREKFFTYTVAETGSVAGVSNDLTAKKTFTVTLKDDGNGGLTAERSNPNDPDFTFTNTYSVEPKDSSLTGDPDGNGEGYVPVTKELTGRDLVAGEFEFQLTNADGTVVAKGTNDAEGKVSMKSVTFSEPGTYSYTLSEVQGNAERVTYDASEYAVTAEVVDNGNGTMSVVWYAASEDQPNGVQEIVFENSYEAEEVAPPVTPDPGVGGEPEPEPEVPAVSDDSDDKEPVLAKTGDATFLLLTGVGVLAVLAAGVCLFARRRLS